MFNLVYQTNNRCLSYYLFLIRTYIHASTWRHTHILYIYVCTYVDLFVHLYMYVNSRRRWGKKQPDGTCHPWLGSAPRMTTLTPSYHAENYSPDDNRRKLSVCGRPQGIGWVMAAAARVATSNRAAWPMQRRKFYQGLSLYVVFPLLVIIFQWLEVII